MLQRLTRSRNMSLLGQEEDYQGPTCGSNVILSFGSLRPCHATLAASCTRGRLALAPRGRQRPDGADLPCGLSATDRSGCRGTSVAAALPLKGPRAWMVDKVLPRDVRHGRRKATYLRSTERQDTYSASSRNRLNLQPIFGNQHQSQERQSSRRRGFLQSTRLQAWS